jgi:hypothetical protein
MKNLFRKIIKRLYFKYCFKQSDLAQDIVLYYIPAKLQKETASMIVAQINKGILANREPLKLVGFGSLSDFTQLDVIENANQNTL